MKKGVKIFYIAHPISGELYADNIGEVYDIISQINQTSQPGINHMAIAPYLVDLETLNNEDDRHKRIGMRHNQQYFDRKFIDVLRLYGDHISKGMFQEVMWAFENGIPIQPMTEGTLISLAHIFPKRLIKQMRPCWTWHHNAAQKEAGKDDQKWAYDVDVFQPYNPHDKLGHEYAPICMPVLPKDLEWVDTLKKTDL